MKYLLFPTILCVIALAPPAAAQMGGAGNAIGSAQPITNHLGSDTMTQERSSKLAGPIRSVQAADEGGQGQGQDRGRSEKGRHGCGRRHRESDERLAGAMPNTFQGAGNLKGYEIACGDGMGYFVGTSASGTPYGLSCLTAQAKHDFDAANGHTDDAECRLPANADLKAGVGHMLGGLGKACVVQKIEWMGRSDATKSEYNEAACADGHGFVLVSAEPGSTAPPHAFSCEEAAAQGIGCKLTKVAGGGGVATITLQTFKDALSQHKVACDAGGERVIGQENVQKRYVVEFKCTGQPKGLVAFIPTGANTAPFETTDCATAAKRGLACKLNATE